MKTQIGVSSSQRWWAQIIMRWFFTLIIIVVFSLLTVPVQSATNCAQVTGLVGWWQGNGNADDKVGVSSGAILGGVTFEPGEVAQAFFMHAGTDGVRIPAAPPLDVGAGNGMTIEAWVNPKDVSRRNPLVEWNRGGTTPTEWGAQLWLLQPGDFGLPSGGSLFANLAEANGTGHFLYTTNSMVRTGLWQHVALTYDKTLARARLYVNGALVEDQSIGIFQPATSWDLFLGRRPAGDGTASYDGGLDEVGVYNRALSSTEIQAIYNAGSAGKCNTGGPPPTPPPVLSTISDFVVLVDQPTTAIQLGLTDADTALSALRLSAVSSNPALVPDANVFFAMAQGNWYMTVTPVFGQTGTATITVRVSDGQNQTSTAFHFTVNGPPAGSARFVNGSAINIPTQGVATPYPSTVEVKGMNGTVTGLVLSLDKFSHQNIRDVNMLLVAPTGLGVVLFSHVCGNRSVSNVRVQLSDQAIYDLPMDFDLWAEPLRPTAFPPAVTFPSPAPAGPYGPVRLSTFNGLAANGVWSLYLYDDAALAAGSIVGGWSLLVSTSSGTSAPTISGIPDQVTSLNVPTGPIPFTIFDADTALSALTLARDSSNPTLVPLDNIVFGGSGSNRTVTVTPAANQTGTATITVKVSDGTLETTESFALTVRPPDNNQVLTVTVNNATRVYGQPNPTFSGTLLGLQAGDNIGATYVTSATGASPIGSYPIRPVLSDPDHKLAQYTVVTNLGSLRLTPAPLTVRADDHSRLYASSNPSFTGSMTGNRPGDSIAISYSTTASKNSPVGFYPITPTLGSQGVVTNYTVRIEPGSLTVTPAPLTVRADDKTRAFGAPNPNLTGSKVGDENRDKISVTYATTANYTSLPANYPIRPTLHDPQDRLSNYRVSIRDGTLTVTLLPQPPPVALPVLEVQANDITRPYRAPNPELTGTIAGLRVGDNITVTYTTDATQQSPPGIYAITPHLIDPGNLLDLYVLSTRAGTLTVTPVGTVRLTSVTGVYPHHLSGQGDAGLNYIIQASSDLVHWQELGRAVADATGRLDFDVAEKPEPSTRFFRVVLP